MSTHLTAPLRTAAGYYKRAWRIALRARHPRWNEQILKRNLAWLWASRTQAEEAACEALVAAGSLMLPVVDLEIMPQRTVGRRWWPLKRGQGASAGSVGGDDGGTGGGGTAGGTAPIPATGVNTTRFAFWPQTGDIHAPIPDIGEGVERLFEAGTLLPDSDTDTTEGTWRGAVPVGEGTAGHVYLFCKMDADNRIIDRMAIKDSKPMDRLEWVNPTSWRDHLPKEIAIQQRLAAQGIEGIAPFRGYRLNMTDRRYRQYFDFCDYRGLDDVLVKYWGLHSSPAAQIRREERRDNPSMLAPPTIPEPFIWHVFQSLVNTLFLLRDGNNQPLPNNEAWKPIVHLDICLSNIFVAPAQDADGKPLHPPYADYSTNPTNKDKTLPIPPTQWPRILLADFDMAMFSLQDDPADSYQDNPFHYLVDVAPDTASSAAAESLGASAASRYPPELFRTFYEKSGDAERPLDSATDIWALGQVMWCLLTNLEHGGDFRPRWENEGGDSAEGVGRIFINDGEKYGREDLENRVFSEDEVARGYSAALKGVVRDCLNWHPRDRPGLEELRSRIEGAEGLKGDGALLLRVPGDVERWLVGGMWNEEVVE